MEIDPVFFPNNLHHESIELFLKGDPNLRRLHGLPYVSTRPVISEIPVEIPGIYSLGGGRQVGKTTLLKQWMAQLLSKGVPPQNIVFLTGELIDDHHALVRIIQELIGPTPGSALTYIILDEVTYIREWDRGVKYLADSGCLEKSILILTGSDMVFLQQARIRFPGRRGKAETADFHLYPLSFREFFDLKEEGHSSSLIEKSHEAGLDEKESETLFRLFQEYLIHGGYLTAINDFAGTGTISPSTLTIYSEWLRGDMLNRGKQEIYLRDLLGALLKQAGSQTTWHSLAGMTGIDHHKTVSDYIEILSRMDALFIQYALQEHNLSGAPKKARKIIFTDPFIFHSVRYWLKPVLNPWENQISPFLGEPEEASKLAEAVAIEHYRRYFPCYYIKAEGEVDIAYLKENRFYPVEIKWTRQLHAKELKQILKYPDSVILANVSKEGILRGVPVLPLPLALLELCSRNRERYPWEAF